MARRITPDCRGCMAGFRLAATASLLLALYAPAQGAPDPAATLPTALRPGLGLGGIPMGQRSADAHFILMMIPHHQGAIAMAALALTQARRPETRALARRIIASQSREVSQMRQWYGADVPSWDGGPGYGSSPGMGTGPRIGMGMGGGMGMPGMTTSLEALKTARDFDRPSSSR